MTRGLIIYLAGWKTVVVDAEELLAGINDDG
jgi:hypothetical protein